ILHSPSGMGPSLFDERAELMSERTTERGPALANPLFRKCGRKRINGRVVIMRSFERERGFEFSGDEPTERRRKYLVPIVRSNVSRGAELDQLILHLV